MLSGDVTTFKAVRELRHIIDDGKPVVIWIGAGVSTNAGLPSWPGLAEAIHREFRGNEPTYSNATFANAVTGNTFPAYFYYCKSLNPQRYRTQLTKCLSNGIPNSIYLRLCTQLGELPNLRVVTTNADELLESRIPFSTVIQRSDIERLKALLLTTDSFLCKLHGTVSAVQSLVFAEDEYAQLVENQTYIEALETMFSQATVVFLGYSLQEAYLIKLLQDRVNAEQLFGNGPHFLVTASPQTGLPSSIRQIAYNSDAQVGHRGFLTVLDLLKVKPASDAAAPPAPQMQSKFYLPDFIEVGKWQSSQTLEFSEASGQPAGVAYVGTGFIDSELNTVRPLGLHNLVIGLICYEKTVLPIESIGAFHRAVGSSVFWKLIEENCIECTWVPTQPSVVFSHQDLVSNGGLVSLQIQNQAAPAEPESFESLVFRQIQIIKPGHLTKEAIVEKLRSITTDFNSQLMERALSESIGALVMPDVRIALGISDGITPARIPKWFVFPVLRIAYLMKDSAVAESIGAAATQLPFGTHALANAAFSLKTYATSAGDVASYVVAGRFGVDLGRLFNENSGVLEAILRFRESNVGANARHAILQTTAFNAGHELPASIDGALREAFPTRLLEDSRVVFANLFTAADRVALWTSPSNNADDFKRWRKRSAGILKGEVDAKKIAAYSYCPCGSGDRFRFCCMSLLSEL